MVDNGVGNGAGNGRAANTNGGPIITLTRGELEELLMRAVTAALALRAEIEAAERASEPRGKKAPR